MNDAFQRTALLLGEKAMQKLNQSRVLILGVGGVGGYAIESLVRSGIGAIDLLDHDIVSKTNLNRQIIALEETLGKNKLEVWKTRIHSISPSCKVTLHSLFLLPTSIEQICWTDYDYVIDAIDTISSKIAVAEKCHSLHIPLISCMGMGNKTNPKLVTVSTLNQTSGCPVAKVMRHELKGIPLKVVYSTEISKKITIGEENGKHIPSSIIFVPATAGLLLAKEVIDDLIKEIS